MAHHNNTTSKKAEHTKTSPLQRTFRWLKKKTIAKDAIPRLLVNRYIEDQCLDHAAVLAYTTLFALVPVLTIVIAVMSLSEHFAPLRDSLDDVIMQYLVPTARETVIGYLQEFRANAEKMRGIGLVAIFLSTLLLLMDMERVFNQIWRATKSRHVVSRALHYVVIVTLTPVLLTAMVSVSLPLIKRAEGFVPYFDLVSPLPVEIVAFLLLYYIMPNARVRLSHAFVGAVFAAVLLEISRFGLALYLDNVHTYENIYGAMAVFPIFLLWIYLSWLSILLGAELAALLGERTDAS